MILASLWALFWIVIAVTMPPSVPWQVRYGTSTALALYYLMPWCVANWYRYSHIRAQNQLLDRCRALFILGARSFADGDYLGAKNALDRIRRLEQHWAIGNTLAFRVILSIWAIGASLVIGILLMFSAALISHHGWTQEFPDSIGISEKFLFAVSFTLFGTISALTSYFESWVTPGAIENCGDRLSQLMYGPRAVVATPISEELEIPSFDGMSPLEVFGLSPGFKRRELDIARRRLVQQLHPDRWHQASERERRLREEALKRVNAAYDHLRRG